MVKFEIFNEEPEKETIVKLKLFKCRTGGVTLCAVDTEGRQLNDGYILRITDEGLMRNLGCDVPGVPTDTRGRIKLM